MKFISALVIIVIFFTCSIGCKKNDTGASVQQDTLATGWKRITVSPGITAPTGGDIFFKNYPVGYYSNNNSALFKSTNGGDTWTQISTLSAANLAVTSDDKLFFTGPSSSLVYKSIDGGKTITSDTLTGAANYDIYFSDNNTGLCSTSLGIYMTADGGISWNNVSALPPTNGSALTMYDNSHAWAVYDNKIIHANGDLNTWIADSIANGPDYLSLRSVYATSPSVVYTCSASGYFYRSVDGGFSFSLLKKLDPGISTNSLSDIHFTDANVGYVSLGNRIFKTTDAGNTWNVIVALAKSEIIEIHFSDPSHGWACCFDGTILKFN